jgi:Lipocalin-like domain
MRFSRALACGLAVTCVAVGWPVPAKAQSDRDLAARFVGAWRLVSWDNTMADGTTRKSPMSVGSLLYSDSGRMCAILMDPNRQAPKSQPPSEAEVKTAYDGVVAYCARVEVHGREGYILHYVDLEKSPAVIGRVRKRWFTFETPDRLVLRVDATELGPATKEQRLVWERVK